MTTDNPAPTEDTPTPQGGLAHDTRFTANNNQVDNRPLGLRMGYESMWSLLDDVSTDDLMAERDRFRELEKSLRAKAVDIDSRRDKIQQKSRVLEEVISNRKWAETRDKFKLNDNHITLVKMLYFGKLDTVPSLTDSYAEMAKKLGWKLPNEYVSDEQAEALEHLIYELPLALEAVIAGNDLIATDLIQDTVTPSRPGGHKKQELEGLQ